MYYIADHYFTVTTIVQTRAQRRIISQDTGLTSLRTSLILTPADGGSFEREARSL